MSSPQYIISPQDRYVFHCWDCDVVFSDFFDRALNINSRMVQHGCYENYFFIGEHYTTYNLKRGDVEKRTRWRLWAKHFQKIWCPEVIETPDERFATLIDRSGAQNGRNMNNCIFENSSHTKRITPTLSNVAETCSIVCNSRSIISAEGNGLTNMLLMQPSSLIAVIWQTNRPVGGLKSIYGNMAELLGHHMVGIPVQSDSQLNANCSDTINDLIRDVLTP